MEPTQFFILILPLTLWIVVVVGIILYTASRSGEDEFNRKQKSLKNYYFQESLIEKHTLISVEG
jgi:hypothetical protein